MDDITSCKCSTWCRTEPPLFTKHHPDCERYEKKMVKTYTVYPFEGSNPCTEKDVEALMIWIEEAEPADTIKIVVGEMDEAVFNELPEYMGP